MRAESILDWIQRNSERALEANKNDVRFHALGRYSGDDGPYAVGEIFKDVLYKKRRPGVESS